jgi:hypothetical protein
MLAAIKIASLKGVAALFAPAVGMMAFFSAIEFNVNPWVALVVSALFSSLTAYFTARPKMVSASSSAQVAERQQAMTEWTALLKQNNENHAEQIRELRKEVTDLGRKVTLIRISKHNVMDDYGAAYLHIQLLESILKDNNLTIPKFTPRTVKEMVGVEDDEILKTMNGNGK